MKFYSVVNSEEVASMRRRAIGIFVLGFHKFFDYFLAFS